MSNMIIKYLYRNDILRYYKVMDDIKYWIAWRMPRWLVYYCSVRMIANATTGQYGKTEVPRLTAMDALGRWEN